MRNRQSLISKHRLGMSAGVAEAAPDNGPSEALVAAAVEALNDMGNVVSSQCFAHPDALTRDGITTYALALMRLRECAQAAGLERLMKACDALAITVSRLFEDQTEACRERCEALTRFVAHAEAMIRMATERAARHALPLADLPAAGAPAPLSGHA
jgi:hypothetical protein